MATAPPPLREFNSESSLTMELLDRRGGLLDLEHFEEAALEFVDQARTTGRFERVSTRFDASAPQLELIADGELMAVPGLPFRATLCRRSVPPSADDASATPIMRDGSAGSMCDSRERNEPSLGISCA